MYLNTTHFQNSQHRDQNLIKLNDTGVRTAIHHALKQWEGISLLTFTEQSHNANADIKISFQTWDHGDGYNFDGKGHILAHAFYPTKGVVHIDVDEDWDFVSLRQVLTHEFGHSLGLGHSSDNKSIMFPWFSSSIDRVNDDDKNGIEWLYGLKSKWGKITPRIPIIPTMPSIIPDVTTTPRFIPKLTPRFGDTTRSPINFPKDFPIKRQHGRFPSLFLPNNTIVNIVNIINSSIENLYVYSPPSTY